MTEKLATLLIFVKGKFDKETHLDGVHSFIFNILHFISVPFDPANSFCQTASEEGTRNFMLSCYTMKKD